ncbi:MAG: hypothetical protein H7X93_11720 [Sphingomonadaceae bacterium]|nr:hypothetical protein [Sphingomonadaceae bacterium]
MRPFVIAALLLGVAAPALGQDAAELDDRLDLVERQLRAVQREVFPGGNPQFFEPEIQPAAPGQPPPGGSTGPIVDLTERISALEARLADITNTIEQNEYRIGQIEARLAAMEAAAAPPAPMLGVEDNRIDPPITGEELGDEPPADPPRMDEESADPVPLPDGAPIGPAGADPDLPSDAGEASYVRGYRLWRDRDYPAAQEQLRATIEEFPGHRFESYARNLLGRAYLDEGKPANAVEIFVDNYRDLPNGERAADSLFYLGVALTQLNYADRACLAFQELREVFGDGLRSDISEQLPAARRAASCE